VSELEPESKSEPEPEADDLGINKSEKENMIFPQDEDEVKGQGINKCPGCGKSMPWGRSVHIEKNINCGELILIQHKFHGDNSESESVELETESAPELETEPKVETKPEPEPEPEPEPQSESESESASEPEIEPEPEVEKHMNEEEIYELISQEIDNDEKKKGLWTKAFSEAEGDENKAKALYIKYRFYQIQDGLTVVVKESNKEIVEKQKQKNQGGKNREESLGSVSPLKNEEFKNRVKNLRKMQRDTTESEKISVENMERKYDSFFYLKLVIVVEFILIFLGLIGKMKVDFLIMNLGLMLGISLWVYIYFVWKKTNSNLFIKFLISSVALLLSFVVPLTFDMTVKKAQKEIWYQEVVDEILKNIKLGKY